MCTNIGRWAYTQLTSHTPTSRHHSWCAILVSVTLVLVVGEILPTSVFSGTFTHVHTLNGKAPRSIHERLQPNSSSHTPNRPQAAPARRANDPRGVGHRRLLLPYCLPHCPPFGLLLRYVCMAIYTSHTHLHICFQIHTPHTSQTPTHPSTHIHKRRPRRRRGGGRAGPR